MYWASKIYGHHYCHHYHHLIYDRSQGLVPASRFFQLHRKTYRFSMFLGVTDPLHSQKTVLNKLVSITSVNTYLAVESNCPRADAKEHASSERWHTATEWQKPTHMKPGILHTLYAPVVCDNLCAEFCLAVNLSKVCQDCKVPYLMFHTMITSSRQRTHWSVW